MSNRRRVVLISYHYLKSKRRAGFAWLAHALWQNGWNVTFATVALSPLSRLRGDDRLAYNLKTEFNRLITVDQGLSSYVWYTPFHPVNLRFALLNKLATPIFRRYGDLPLGELSKLLGNAELIVFESTAGLMLFDSIKTVNRSARYVYRVSDDLKYLGLHPVILDAETHAAPQFDMISAPSESIYRKFAHLPQATLQYHGLQKELFDRDQPSPFVGLKGRNAVYIGIRRLDTAFINIASEALPDWNFHIVGRTEPLPSRDNIIHHGEVPFDQTIAFMRHADIGLATYCYAPGAETLSDTLKIIQYTYAQIPIVAPTFIVDGRREHVIGYKPGDRRSIVAAITKAAAINHQTIDRSGIYSWDELARSIAGISVINQSD